MKRKTRGRPLDLTEKKPKRDLAKYLDEELARFSARIDQAEYDFTNRQKQLAEEITNLKKSPKGPKRIKNLEDAVQYLQTHFQNEISRLDDYTNRIGQLNGSNANEIQALKSSYNRLVDEKINRLMQARGFASPAEVKARDKEIDKERAKTAMDDHDSLCKNADFIFRIVNHIPRDFPEEQVFLVKHFVTENKDLIRSRAYVEWALSWKDTIVG